MGRGEAEAEVGQEMCVRGVEGGGYKKVAASGARGDVYAHGQHVSAKGAKI